MSAPPPRTHGSDRAKVLPMKDGDLLDRYMEAFLNSKDFLLRSFAFGMPYFEVSGQYSQKYDELLNDIENGRLSPTILEELFGGLTLEEMPEVVCYITDSRRSVPRKYAKSLNRLGTGNKEIQIRHKHRVSDTALFNDEEETQFMSQPPIGSIQDI